MNKLLSDNKICLVWNQLDTIPTTLELTSDLLNLRFIAHRSIDEKDFGTVQKDWFKEHKIWSDIVRGIKGKAKFAVVRANNHYAAWVLPLQTHLER
jgi:hypothetical protein